MRLALELDSLSTQLYQWLEDDVQGELEERAAHVAQDRLGFPRGDSGMLIQSHGGPEAHSQLSGGVCLPFEICLCLLDDPLILAVPDMGIESIDL